MVIRQLRSTSDSCGSSSRATAEKQNEKVEKPDTNCGHGCSHVGPSGSPQNLLNSDYRSSPRMIPWLTSKSFARELALNSTGKVRKAKREDDPKRMIPTQVRVGSCSSNPATNAQGATCESELHDRHDVSSCLHREVVLGVLQCMPRLVSRNASCRDAR